MLTIADMCSLRMAVAFGSRDGVPCEWQLFGVCVCSVCVHVDTPAGSSCARWVSVFAALLLLFRTEKFGFSRPSFTRVFGKKKPTPKELSGDDARCTACGRVSGCATDLCVSDLLFVL